MALYRSRRDPLDMAEKVVSEFLTHLAEEQNVAALTQDRSLSALLFLEREALRKDLDLPLDSHRAQIGMSRRAASGAPNDF